ncbi:MAG: hypothetical protein AAF688_05315 [Bacteroidota bacterium]
MLRVFSTSLLILLVFSCKSEVSDTPQYEWKSKTVTATAFNSVSWQTDNDPVITAFGDSLRPGMKCIAVSRNLLNEGLGHNTPVKIEGLEGTYLVKDKMNKRFFDKIDIYMGTDVKAARTWGRKKLEIKYRVEVEPDSSKSGS